MLKKVTFFSFVTPYYKDNNVIKTTHPHGNMLLQNARGVTNIFKKVNYIYHDMTCFLISNFGAIKKERLQYCVIKAITNCTRLTQMSMINHIKTLWFGLKQNGMHICTVRI